MTDRSTLLQKIDSLEGLTTDEKAQLKGLLNTQKKYGLVWEDKPEEVERQLLENLPVLVEVKERYIAASQSEPVEKTKSKKGSSEAQLTLGLEAAEENPENQTNPVNPDSDNFAPHHILIEGDNLHALTALSFTHKEKIDVIYIDPPYNTGNKDFKYNDSFVDKEDSYRHSKWLSFMHKRLVLAKQLLKETGVIFISIDDNEQAQLKLLCDSVFGEENFVGGIVWYKKRKGSFLSNKLVSLTEYILPYSKIRGIQLFGGLPDNTESQPIIKRTNSRGILNFPSGLVKTKLKIEQLQAGEYGDGSSSVTLLNDIEIKDGFFQSAFSLEGPFVWSQSYLDNELNNGTEVIVNTLNLQVRVIRHNNTSIKALSSYLDGRDFSATNEDAYELLQNVFNTDRPFAYSKPTNLISKLLLSATYIRKDAVIMDFFSGSGTTLHAAMQLNAEDGGNRQCILVTNNENNIAEEVCYERNKRVIDGYTKPNGEKVNGLRNNHLHYYKAAFVPAQRNQVNRRQIVDAATEIICIRESAFTEVSQQYSLAKESLRLFQSDLGQYTLVLYYHRYMDEAVAKAVELVHQLSIENGPVKVYAFAPQGERYEEEFETVKDKISVIPLPEAIYNAYQSSLRRINVKRYQDTGYTDTASGISSDLPEIDFNAPANV